MTLVTNSHGSQTEAIEDIAYLTRSVHRVEVLEALTEGPKYRSDLPALTGVSRSTIRRTIREFESRTGYDVTVTNMRPPNSGRSSRRHSGNCSHASNSSDRFERSGSGCPTSAMALPSRCVPMRS